MEPEAGFEYCPECGQTFEERQEKFTEQCASCEDEEAAWTQGVD